MGIDADHISQQSEQLRTTGMLVIPESPLRLWGSLLGVRRLHCSGGRDHSDREPIEFTASLHARRYRFHRILRSHRHPSHCQEIPSSKSADSHV